MWCRELSVGRLAIAVLTCGRVYVSCYYDLSWVFSQIRFLFGRRLIRDDAGATHLILVDHAAPEFFEDMKVHYVLANHWYSRVERDYESLREN